MAPGSSDEAEGNTRGLALIQQGPRVEAALWRRSRHEQDQDARIRLFEQHEALAKTIARAEFAKRRSLGFEFAEIRQLAFEGLMQAIDRFDADKGVPFSAFARLRIRGNVTDGLAKTSEAAAHFRYRQRAEKERLNSLSAAASDEANPLKQIAKLSALLAMRFMLEGHADLVADTTATTQPNAYDTLAWAQMQQRLGNLLHNLPERERFVLVQHYHNDRNFSAIAETLGLTKGRISQIHKASLLRLRSELERFR